MAEKSWGKTVKGWFIVSEDEPSAPEPVAPGKGKAAPAGKPGKPAEDPADDIIRRYAQGGGGPAAAARPADKSPAKSPSGEAPPDFGGGPAVSAPAAGAGGVVDFAATFRQAGIEDAEADRVEKTLGLLANLPPETPLALKKQIVETSLKAFGVPIESIIETAVAEIQALHGCIEAGGADTQKLLGDSEGRITALEEQILQIRQIMDARRQEQKGLETQARQRGLKVQQILEFFGQEKVGQVVHDSPRLVEPEK